MTAYTLDQLWKGDEFVVSRSLQNRKKSPSPITLVHWPRATTANDINAGNN